MDRLILVRDLEVTWFDHRLSTIAGRPTKRSRPQGIVPEFRAESQGRSTDCVETEVGSGLNLKLAAQESVDVA